jgi:hypothetical protein
MKRGCGIEFYLGFLGAMIFLKTLFWMPLGKKKTSFSKDRFSLNTPQPVGP